MRKFLTCFVVILFGPGPAGEPQNFEEPEREHSYRTWELLIIYILLIGMAIMLYLTYQA